MTEHISGLTSEQVNIARAKHGDNALPEEAAASLLWIFFHQFLNPLIYILLAAAAVSLWLEDYTDALFIGIVLTVNGAIGAVQEYSAGRAAAALKALEHPVATVMRDGKRQEIAVRSLVPGDLVLLDTGVRVPADMELIHSIDLRVDESLLTGESKTIAKKIDESVFAGTIITRGRGSGIVSATGTHTRMGQIAEHIRKRSISKPPLMIRMEGFTRRLTLVTGIVIMLLVIIGLIREISMEELFMMAVGLAVSAIPEGLPIAISVALAIGMRRMAKASVIVRHMPAAESLGSCTLIATDKTGTLTMNRLTVTDVRLPGGSAFTCEVGHDLKACRMLPEHGAADTIAYADRLLKAATLPNEAMLFEQEGSWKGMGDTVDIALLAAAHKGGLEPEVVRGNYPLVERIPYEPERKYAASFHQSGDVVKIFVKGAAESLIGMSDTMNVQGNIVPIDREALLAEKDALAAKGLRVLAFAEGQMMREEHQLEGEAAFGHHHLVNLTFLGLVGMQDPIRPEVPQAIRDCYSAGIEVVMITGDDPITAAAIARDAGLAFDENQVVTGTEVKQAEAAGEAALDALTGQARIYARVEPIQKLSIVLSLSRQGHFVAVTGDGVNDAPALKHAHVGVAMGRSGTDVAKESAGIILTDDNFASIVGGIREGRVAYNNIRKVIFMLISTGAGEVVLFTLALLAGLPMPLLAVQLLWLNLATNVVQDIALACEKAEGDELLAPPRRPGEPIFDRIMIRRILHSALVMGVGGFGLFYWLLEHGYAEEQARNLLLLLFVLFENFQTFNSRSEHHSVFRQSIRANPLLVLGVVGAQILHIMAMYLPGLSDVLRAAPVSMTEWFFLLLAASSLLLVMELEKYWDGRSIASWNKRRKEDDAG